MRKTLAALIFTITLLAPVGHFVFAAGFGYMYTGKFTLGQDTSYNGETSARLWFNIKDTTNGQTFPVDNAPTGQVGFNDNFGYIDGLKDQNLENSESTGIFLAIGEVGTSQITAQQLPALGPAVTSKISNTGIQYNIQVNSNPAQQHFTTAYATGERGVNIGYYIYKIDPAKFFGSQEITGSVPITGLQAGHTYSARIFTKRQDSQNNYLISGFSDIITFHTAAAGQATNQEGDILSGVTFQGTVSQAAEDARIKQHTKDCSVFGGWDECFVRLLFSTVYKGTAWIMQMTGRLFDAFVHLALESKMYRDSTFVYDGWRIVRDLSNILFIFILLYIAIGTILGLHSVNPKKMIAQLIIVGLLINFSMFFTRVVIDLGNIFAYLFYNKITVILPGNPANAPNSIVTGAVKEKSLSEAIASGLRIQAILSPDSFNKAEQGKSGGLTTGTLFAFIVIGIILNLATAWLFFSCAAFFVGRIGMLWFSVIFAPFAFVSSIIPTLDKKFKDLGWSKWLSGLMSASINAGVFMFFMYLIIALIRGPFLHSILADAQNFNFWEYLAAIILPMMIILGLMKAAKDIAKEMGGQFGEMISSAVNTTLGVIGGVALGGAALATSGIAGAAARRIGQSERLANWATGKNKDGTINSNAWSQKIFKQIGKAGIVGSAKAQRASFDARNTGVANLLTKATGVNLNAVASVPGLSALGVENTALGTKGRQEKSNEKFQKSLADLGLDQHKFDEETDKLNDRKDYEQMTEELTQQAQTEATRIYNTTDKDSKENKEAQNNLAAIKRFQDVIKNGGTIGADEMMEGDTVKILDRVKALDKSGKLMTDPTKIGEKDSAGNDLSNVSTAGLNFTQKRFVEAYKGKDGKIYDSTGKERNDLLLDKKTGRYAEWDKDNAGKPGYDKDGFAVKKYSISANEAAVENLKTARQKDFVRMLQRDSGLQMRKSVFDAMGNIKVLGRVQGRIIEQDARSFGRAFTRTLKSSLKGAIIAGVAGAVSGGAALPLAAFLLGGGVGAAKEAYRGFSPGTEPEHPHHLGPWAKYVAGRDLEAHDYAHMDPGAKHEHSTHAKVVYKTSAKDFLSELLSGLGKSSGGGHGGGGHDDHGGGDHGGHH